MNEMKEGNELLELLSSFSCEKDKENYFSEVARIPDENQPMVQMIRKIG